MSRSPQLRGSKVIAVILDAALAELSEKGYDGLSIEAVAERSGVNKTTVYRRWPTKNELAHAALAREGDSLLSPPETGSLAEDLFVVAQRLRTLLQTPRGRALHLVQIHRASSGAPLPPLTKSRRAAHALIERGVERGELPPGVDVELVTSVFFGTVMQRSLLGYEKPTNAFFRKLVAFIIAGARDAAGAARAGGPREPAKSGAPPGGARQVMRRRARVRARRAAP